jgi:hypothetical protein
MSDTIQTAYDRLFFYRYNLLRQVRQQVEWHIMAMLVCAGAIDWHTYACIVYRALSPVKVTMKLEGMAPRSWMIDEIGGTRIDLLPA